MYVETDFLLALTKDSDWLQESAEDALDEHEVETSAFSYLELVFVRERYEDIEVSRGSLEPTDEE